MLQRGLNRSNALAGLSFRSQVILKDTRMRSERSVSLVRSDRKIMGVAAQAVHDRGRVFTTLGHLIDEDFLREAYRQTRHASAPGIDGVTAQASAEHLDENRRDLYDRLRRGCSQAAPVERVGIEKEGRGQRPIGKPAVEDKLLQLAVARLLEALDAQDLRRGRAGYRVQVGALEAVETLSIKLHFGRYAWVVEADIQKFFDYAS